MSGSGFRGVSAAQDGRFSDKDKKLLKSTKFPDSFNTRVDMAHVSTFTLWKLVRRIQSTQTTQFVHTGKP
jgi:hypothetical protein